MMGRFTAALAAGCATFVIAAGGIARAGSSETIIHDFADPTGEYPKIGPVIDASTGAIYGVTWQGGANGYGVVYQLLPPTGTNKTWSYSVIYNSPVDSFTQLIAKGGIVYGTGHVCTDGPNCNHGAVFSLTPPNSGAGSWISTILYAFTDGSDGADPIGSLTMDQDGALYGTTYSGGTGCRTHGGCGTVFRLAPPASQGQPWNFSVLYHFPGGKAGKNPGDGVIFDKQGNLYGSASVDYPNSGKSLIFKLTPSAGAGEWTESILYRFYPTSKCYSSGPLAIDADGALYGVFSAHASGGYSCNDTSNEYVFQLAPSKSNPNVWVKTVMRGFTPAYNAGGYELTAPVTVDSSGNVYGTTILGGANEAGTAGGTAFVLRPVVGSTTKWTYKALLDFLGLSTGYSPNGGMVFDSAGTLYGTTEYGGLGGHAGHGVVFSLSP